MTTDASVEPKVQAFNLTSFLEGRTRAWGLFEDRFGFVRRRFNVEMTGKWQGEAFYLDESFSYDDGSRETRVWRVVPTGPDRFIATSADCVGTARGEHGADSIRMAYRFKLQMERGAVHVDMDDRIYRVGEAAAVNRATMRKWGVRLGEISLFFLRVRDLDQDGGDRAAA